ncbi:MAG: flavodoxin family protein [Acidiferrobacterales bacterium]|nr:flavodoxin family protein [Acidiferrobacterales bacterium]
MKKIVCIQGSPRKNGNTQVLLDAFCAGAEAGGEFKKYHLDDMQYRGCRNLMHCKTVSEYCGQNDDLTPVLADIRAADIVVLASPIYFTDITGPLKLCLDRWFSFFVPQYAGAIVKSRLQGEKTLVFIQTQGEGEDQYADVITKYNHSLSWLGFSSSHLLRAPGVRDVGDIYLHPQKIDQARNLGEQLACSTLSEGSSH